MSEETRSYNGCWTCRVRRKKCDETMPTCSTCSSLSLPCYGYGPKPAWMDRGPREREVAKSLRDAVKFTHSMRRLRLSNIASQTREIPLDEATVPFSRCPGVSKTIPPSVQSIPIASVAPALEDSDAGDLNHSIPLNESHPNEAPTPAALVIRDKARNEASNLRLTNDSWSILPANFEEDQARLLMHYFDHVLPRQFRFYNPTIPEGGRGWLLSIITNTRPLYHVVLSLAAFHQQSVIAHGSGVPCTASLEKLQERHVECIKILRHHLENFTIDATTSFEGCVDIMACITILIALELFRGDTSNWQMHLKAASNLALSSRLEVVKTSPLSHAYQTGITFFTAVIIWYDIMSCASTGLKPFTDFDVIHKRGCPPLQFDKLMGCETWVMRLIWDIASLRRLKKQSGNQNSWDLMQKAADIETRLEKGLDGLGSSLTQVMTRIYAGAALVYLQTTISGPYAEDPKVQLGVSRTMAALDALDRDLVRHLLWPVCIAGCMATTDHETYWRDLVSGVVGEAWSIGYPGKVLRVMEECWKLRKSQPGIIVAADWLTAMGRVGMKVLLV